MVPVPGSDPQYRRPVHRHCSRPTCAEPATATLTYQYADRSVWLDFLSDERDPHAYDLCRRHADRLRAPSGWAIVDRRSERAPVLEVARAG